MASRTFSLSVLSNGAIKKEYSRLPVYTGTLGIITQDMVIVDTGMTNVVQAAAMHDAPKTGPKDGPYRVSDGWVLYMKRLMTPQAWDWWIVAEFMLMINRPSKWGSGTPTQEPMFELIALPNNFVELDKIQNGFGRVVSRSSLNFDTSTLNPERDNWYYRPTEFWKASAHNESGQVFLVGNGMHVYTPNIKQKPEVWIGMDRVELFPKLPMDVTYQGKKYTITGYCLKGASVYGHAEKMDIPLRLARNPRELIHPCPEWKLKEVPVPPEVRPEWQ